MDIQIIDKTQEINTLRAEFAKNGITHKEATKKIAKLWGASTNEHGVFTASSKEKVVEIGRCNGEIRFAQTKIGIWLIGLSGNTAIGGFGYAPSVWNRQGFTSYEDARAFGIERLIVYFEKEAISNNSCSSQSDKDNARKAAEHLKSERTPQLSLF